MDSYFFIPVTRLDKIPKIKNLQVSEIIIDLEDAVKYSERLQLLDYIIFGRAQLGQRAVAARLGADPLWLSFLSFSTASIFSMNCSVSFSIPASVSSDSSVLGFIASILISLLGSELQKCQCNIKENKSTICTAKQTLYLSLQCLYKILIKQYGPKSSHKTEI